MTTTPSSTTFSRGTVVFVNIRFTDDSSSKARPAVVVSADGFHAARDDVLVVPLTARLARRRFGDYVLKDHAAAGLPRASMAKGLVTAIAAVAVDHVLGNLASKDLSGVDQLLRTILALEA